MDIISEFENGDTIARIDGYDMALYAAAPDLLAALEWWQAQMRDDNCDDMGKLLDDMSTKAHAAIAKAKGN
jgi:hypothetical protein